MATGIRSGQRGIKGAFNRFLANHLETVLSIPGSRLYKHFVRAAQDTEGTQRALLGEILEHSADTVIGRERGFAKIRGYEQYAERVPVGDYEDHRPYIDRHARGEEGVLFPGKPIMYNCSSGTTAQPKLIPISQFNFDRTISKRGKLWLYGLMREFPGVFAGKDLSVVSKDVEGHTEDGTPFGSLSGLIYKNIPEFVKLVHTIPYSVMTIEDYDAKIYSLLRFSVPSNVTAMFTGNPSTVHNMVTRADQWKEELIRDVRDGTLRKDLDLEPGIRAEAEAMLEPAPERAAELDRIASSGDRFRPIDYWPDLKLVHTWKNGNCRLVIPKLEPWFGGKVPFLDFGYIASEITATDLLDRETDGSILQVQSAFYEFTRLADEDADDRRFYLAHELEVGERYFIYVTTLSGLYRYDMNDVVEVVGRFHQAPVFKFLFKGQGVTSITGEKLSEQQFIEAVQRGAREAGVEHDFFLGLADVEQTRYVLHIELLGDPAADAVDRFADAVDGALHEVNVEYEAKRKSDRLGPVTVVHMGEGFFDRYRTLRLDEGAHIGQLKWMNLTGTDADRRRLEKLREEA
ncbi:MAG: GH3 auxin-responsive promoter family protein [Deltaproteobacteria bacterium]|nr:GH3 auxin-responsive promoter family protein [Deltaproteobacteria bacterium]